MSEELIALALRCEQASGPDRELDVSIGLLGKFYIAEPRYPGAEPMIGYVDKDGSRVEPGNGAQDWLVPRYTASVDAAMKLVPEGWRFAGLSERNCRSPNWSWKAGLWHPDADTNVQAIDRGCGGPALAICAAALRARSQEPK